MMAGLLSACMLFLTACGGGAPATTSDSSGDAPAATTEDTSEPAADTTSDDSDRVVQMLPEGVPRHETLVVDMLDGRQANVDVWNPYLPGAVTPNAGNNGLLYANLWEIDTVKGEQFGDLAENLPEEVGENTYQFRIRENLKWSDGETLDANDVAFTFNMLMDSDTIPFGADIRTFIVSVEAIDDLTVEIVTHNPEPKLSQRFGAMIWGNGLYVVPEHIWANEDPGTFTDPNPVTSGPYSLIDRDPQGYWFLFEKRADWENTSVGQIVGEPGPGYILYKTFGAEERRIMAAVNNELDVLMDITPESWDILKAQNPESHAWHAEFPYANMSDPCQRGIVFNCTDELYGNKNVRWAMALATDIVSVSQATFNGMMRMSPINTPPTDVLMETYHKPMVSWLTDFELEDGYKPFNPNAAFELVEALKAAGIEGLPTGDQEIIDLFGVGWWNFDTEQATKMLEAEGFTLSGDKWMTPSGEPFEMTIIAPADFEIQSMRLAFAVADSWNRFGVETHVQQADGATFWNNESTGNFEVGSYWPSCGIIPDISNNLDGAWNARTLAPIGDQSSGNRARWSGAGNDKVSEIMDHLMTLPADDPAIVTGMTEVLEVFVEELPFISMFGTSKFVPVTTHYWEGFQSAENDFEGPWWWWSQFKFYTPHIQPTGN